MKSISKFQAPMNPTIEREPHAATRESGWTFSSAMMRRFFAIVSTLPERAARIVASRHQRGVLAAGLLFLAAGSIPAQADLIGSGGASFTLSCPGSPVIFDMNSSSGDVVVTIQGIGTGGSVIAESENVGGTGNGATQIVDQVGFPTNTLVLNGDDSETLTATGTANPREVTFQKPSGNNTQRITFSCNSLGIPNLTINKSHVGDATQGQTGFAYTISVSNIGTGPTSGTVTVGDTLPTGLSVNSISGTGWNCTTAPLACTRSDALAANSSYPDITLLVNVAANAASSVTNTANVSGGGDVTPNNNSDQDQTTVNVPLVPDLTINKSHVGDATQGQTGFAYTISVSNTGTGPTSGTVTVGDTLPTGLSVNSISGTGWTCTTAPLACTRSDPLAANSSYPDITLLVNVAANAASSVTNTANVSGGGDQSPNNNSDQDQTTVNVPLVPDLTVLKTGPVTATRGQTGLEYTIAVSNDGTGPTSGTVTVTDDLPAGLSFASVAEGSDWTCGESNGLLTCTTDEVLAADGSYNDIVVTVNVDADAPDEVTNTASVSVDGDSNPQNNSSTVTTEISDAPVPVLTIEKTGPASAAQGQTGVQYSLLVTNDANAAPTNGTVTVTDTLPDGLTVTSVSGTDWSCTEATLTCTRDDVLQPGESYPPIILTVSVDSDAPASVTNQAGVSGGGDTSVDTDDATTLISGVQNLVLQCPASPLVFTLKQGDSATVSVTGIAAGGNVVASTASATGVVQITDEIGFENAQPLNGAETQTIDATGTDDPRQLTFEKTSASPDEQQVTVSCGDSGLPELAIEKTGPAIAVQGETFDYTIAVANEGTGPTSGQVTVTDTVPAGLTLVSADGPSDWSCSESGNTVSCSTNNVLDDGSSYDPITVTVKVGDSTIGKVSNTASVSGGGDQEGDSSTWETTINEGLLPDLTIDKTGPATAAQGETFDYTIAVANEGTGPTSGEVTVEDTIPAGLTLVSASGSGWSCPTSGNSVTCTTSNVIEDGASYDPITITVTVDEQTEGQVENTATVSGGGEENTQNNSDSVITAIEAVVRNASFSLFKSTDTPTYSSTADVLNYSFEVINTGDVELTNLVLTDEKTDTPPVCDKTTLGVNESTTCTASRQVTDQDIIDGEVVNVAQAFTTETGQLPTESNEVISRLVSCPLQPVALAAAGLAPAALSLAPLEDEDPSPANGCPDVPDEIVKKDMEKASYNFMAQRINLLAMNGPRLAWLNNRLEGGFGGGSNGFDITGENGNITGNFAFSSDGVRRALSGDKIMPTADAPAPYDKGINAWIEGVFAFYNDERDEDDAQGNFFVGYAGIDVEVYERVNIGIMGSLDWMDEDGEGDDKVDGTGWMVGPYVSAEISQGLFFDARVMYGQSQNNISQLNQFEDIVKKHEGDFETERWLAEATISGNYDLDTMTLTPDLRFLYIREDQDDYTVNCVCGPTEVDGTSVELAQLSAGLRLSRVIETDTMKLRPYLAGRLFWNIENPGEMSLVNPGELTVDTEISDDNAVSGMVTVGMDGGSDNMQFGIEGSYSGLFGEDQAIGGRISFGYRF
jgi:uncharacterized repeat protein (TIGR01451 family)